MAGLLSSFAKIGQSFTNFLALEAQRCSFLLDLLFLDRIEVCLFLDLSLVLGHGRDHVHDLSPKGCNGIPDLYSPYNHLSSGLSCRTEQLNVSSCLLGTDNNVVGIDDIDVAPGKECNGSSAGVTVEDGVDGVKVDREVACK